jgi:peptidoglycan/LPS O-acetylase OafA/YrhL
VLNASEGSRERSGAVWGSAQGSRSAETRQAPPGQKFRLDIQGIRALAVLLVVANHLAPGSLPGGYVGVDVFFVVSGYLITTLLVREAESSERLSLSGFYARRARRILPAATVVTIATAVGSLVTLALVRTQTVLTDAVWATFFAANVRFASVGTDYFAQGEPPSPLRHYWSLAVEEQFYLIWPLLLVLCLVLVHRRGSSGRTDLRRTAGALLAVVVVLSLVWSAWDTYASPVTAYFSTFARAWELGIGALCALLPRGVRLTYPARNALAIAGLGAIGYSTLVLTGATPFPGTAALIPVLGAAALLVAGEGERSTAVGRALTVGPLVLIGDLSYSIYLWHWPVIVLVRSNLGPETFGSLPVRLMTLAVVLALSWATFRWVETPFRAGRSWRRTGRALLIYPVSVGVALATVLVASQVLGYRLGEWSHDPAIQTADYQGQRLGDDDYVALVRASVLAAEDGRAVPSDLTPGLLDLRDQTAPLGACDYRTGTTELCPFGDPDAERSIVVFGDSRARALSPAVEEIGRQYGYRVYVLVYSGCTATALQQIDRHTDRLWTGCEDFKTWARATIADLSPDLVMVSTTAGRLVDPETGETLTARSDRYPSVVQQGWVDLFQDLESDAGRVVAFGNTPKLPEDTGVCLSKGDPDLGDCAFPPGKSAVSEAKTFFAAADEAGAESVDASKWFCADGLCPSVVGRYVTMRDSHHMTPDYSRWLATPLAAELGIGDVSASDGDSAAAASQPTD